LSIIIKPIHHLSFDSSTLSTEGCLLQACPVLIVHCSRSCARIGKASSLHQHPPLLASIGAFVLGAVSTNVCPGGSVVISTAAVCQQAAPTLGLVYASGGTSSVYPKGCYKWSNSAQFNTHATGAAQAISTPICASSALGALPAALIGMRPAVLSMLWQN
jgi:hypothetical protein